MVQKYALALAIVAVAGGEASASGYKLTILQDVGGQRASEAFGINDNGQIVGVSPTAIGNFPATYPDKTGPKLPGLWNLSPRPELGPAQCSNCCWSCRWR